MWLFIDSRNFFERTFLVQFFYNRRSDSILILSILTLLNISSIWLYFNIEPLFTTHLFDLFLGFIVVTSLYALYFESKSRYKKVLEKYKSESFLGLSLFYSLISIGIFVYLYEIR